MRKQFEMTEAQHEALIAACKPVPCMMIGGVLPRSPQENANAAWKRLGVELGFDYMTVYPVLGRDERFFSAEPVEPA